MIVVKPELKWYSILCIQVHVYMCVYNIHAIAVRRARIQKSRFKVIFSDNKQPHLLLLLRELYQFFSQDLLLLPYANKKSIFEGVCEVLSIEI